jgi:hypothetical protein
MNTGFRATTAARRTSSAQGAIIAAETKASRCAIRDITAKQENETRRGWSSFADTRHITFSKTIGEDQRFRHFLAAVGDQRGQA